jgi:hypothetical protein
MGQLDASGCINWTGAKGAAGHGVVRWRNKNWPAHRLALAWIEQRNSIEMYALHDCGNASCVNPKHIYWGTQKQNMADRKRHGTFLLGQQSPLARITEAQVIDAWNAYHLSDEPIMSIVERTGVPHGSLRAILAQSNWRSVTDRLTPKKTRKFKGEFGSAHWRSRLTENDVRALRARYDAGEKFTAIAAEVGMSKAAMWRILTRRSWKHIDG